MAEGTVLTATDLGLQASVDSETPTLREVRRRAERGHSNRR